MAYINTIQKRKLFSNFMLLAFLILVAATALLSNALKTPIKNNNEFIEQALVFNNKELQNVTRLSLKNKSGEYIFERADTSTTSLWHMTSPRKLAANSIFVEKLFASLNIIKTKKLLIDDQTNNSNFSLDKPTATLTLNDNANTNLVLNIGIMNTIDNSTYLKISGKQGIYHVEAPSISLENITLNDLIEAKIFDLELNKIMGFSIYKKNIKDLQFSVENKNSLWVSMEDKPLDSVKLAYMIDDFSKIKSSHTLDKLSEAQNKQLQPLLVSPEYIVQIRRDLLKTNSFVITKTITSLVDVTLNEEPHFLIKDEQSDIVYAVKTEFLNVFELKNEALKAIEIAPQ
jgi:hypothetical protein